jgi:DNA-binding beta-propeller fold protein YncE
VVFPSFLSSPAAFFGFLLVVEGGVAMVCVTTTMRVMRCPTKRIVLATILGLGVLLGEGVYPSTTSAQGELFVTNKGDNSVTVYSRTANGDIAPIRRLAGADTGLAFPVGLAVDTVNNELVVVNHGGVIFDPDLRIIHASITVYPLTANFNTPPIRTLSGPKTGLIAPVGIAVDTVNNELVVTDAIFLKDPDPFPFPPSVMVYSRTASGDTAPLRTLSGAATGLNEPTGVVVDTVNDELVVVNSQGGRVNGEGSVTVYSRTASGGPPPIRTLAGPATGLNVPSGVVVDIVNDELVVANTANRSLTSVSSVAIFSRTASGNTPPIRALTGPATGLDAPQGLVVDTANNELVVANYDNNRVRVYNRTASGNTQPIRTLAGGFTVLSEPHWVAVTTPCPPLVVAKEELFVADFLGNSVTVYRRPANGNISPIRTLIGPATQLDGPQGLVVDTVNNELVVANLNNNSITVYGRHANCENAPTRRLAGAATGLNGPVGVVVDNVNDELVVANEFGNSITVYSRTASGNILPTRTLAGATTGLSRPVGVVVDTGNNELVVTNGNNSVTVYSRTASGDTQPIRTLAGVVTGLDSPIGLVVDTVYDELLVTNFGTSFDSSVTVYNRTASGNAPPIRTLAGPTTGLSGPDSLAVDTANDELVVANVKTNSITVYSRTASGDTSPTQTLAGAATGLNGSTFLAITPTAAPCPPLVVAQGELFVADFFSNSVTVYNRTASGNTLPIRTLAGPATALQGPQGVVVDTTHDELVVANLNNNSITVYGRNARCETVPIRRLAGAATGLNGPVGVVVDTVNDELVVTNQFNNSVTAYSRTASGNTLPIRTLAGPATTLGLPAGVVVDTVNNELVVTNFDNTSVFARDAPPSVTVYNRTASGNAPPIRTLAGAATGLKSPIGVVVDTVNNELLVANFGDDSVTVYSRTASGDTPPIRRLAGPTTGLHDPDSLAVDTVNNELLVVNVSDNSVTVYSRTANGDTAPIRALVGPATGLSGPTFLAGVPPTASLASRIDVTTDRAVYQRSQPLSLALQLTRGTNPDPADIYIGLLHPDGTFDSLLSQGTGLALVPTGTAPTAIALNATVPFDFSGPVATRSWTAADPAGTYIAFALRVRPGASPYDQANWLSIGYTTVTLSP